MTSISESLNEHTDAVVTRQIALVLAIAAITFAVLWIGQPQYPNTWFDEGLNLSTARMIAQEGIYALPEAGAPRIMDPAIQTGAPVLLPIALIFRLFGSQLEHARLFISLLSTLTVVVFFTVARRLIGGGGALLAVGFLLAGTLTAEASFVVSGRQVLGESPALLFYLLGMLAWWRAIEFRPARVGWLVLAGVGWGMAVLTKSQLILLIPASVGVLAILNLVYYRATPFSSFVIPGLVVGAFLVGWHLWQIVAYGYEQYQANSAVLREGMRIHVLGINPHHWRNALGALWRSGWWLYGPLGIAWGVWQARHRSAEGFKHASLLSLAIVGLVWFGLFSIGWDRYTYYPFMLSTIWLAGAVVDLWRRAAARPFWRGAIIALAILFVLTLTSATQSLASMFASGDNGYRAMRDYIAAEVPVDSTIETWEWEMSIELPNAFHRPPTSITWEYTRLLFGGEEGLPISYDLADLTASHVLVGPFGGWLATYASLVDDMTPVAEYGQYALYKLDAPSVH